MLCNSTVVDSLQAGLLFTRNISKLLTKPLQHLPTRDVALALHILPQSQEHSLDVIPLKEPDDHE
jgi:hypothetical protein